MKKTIFALLSSVMVFSFSVSSFASGLNDNPVIQQEVQPKAITSFDVGGMYGGHWVSRTILSASFTKGDTISFDGTWIAKDAKLYISIYNYSNGEIESSPSIKSGNSASLTVPSSGKYTISVTNSSNIDIDSGSINLKY